MPSMLANLAILAAAASILVKVALSAPFVTDAKGILDDLSHRLSTRGMLETGRINLTSEGTYQAARYSTLTCRDALVALPILRNSEAKGLMDTPDFPVRYVVGGALHDSLPHLSLWWHNLTMRLGMPGTGLPPLAVVADPACVPDLGRLIL